jgi:hypothetical protein
MRTERSVAPECNFRTHLRVRHLKRLGDVLSQALGKRTITANSPALAVMGLLSRSSTFGYQLGLDGLGRLYVGAGYEASRLLMFENRVFTVCPSVLSITMTTMEMRTRISAYSTMP